MTDSVLPGEERASYDRFPTDSPLADALQAIRTLRRAPKMPEVAPGAPPDEMLRAVTQVALELNERERRLVGALERMVDGLIAMSDVQAEIRDAQVALNERFDRFEKQLATIAQSSPTPSAHP